MRIAVAGASGLIGRHVTRFAEGAGHEVVRLSRSDGVDLTKDDGLDHRLRGVDALVDVVRPASMDRQEAIDFFVGVARRLGQAAQAVGVRRSVVLSIVGIERAQDYDWYVATLAHERAARESYPGVRVLRSTQFHEFPGQVLARSRRDGRAPIMDVPCQPVDSVEVGTQLLDMVTQPSAGDVELAGPRVEKLVDLVRALVASRDDPVVVAPADAPASMATGAMLPGPGALTRGVDWRTWLATR